MEMELGGQQWDSICLLQNKWCEQLLYNEIPYHSVEFSLPQMN